MFLFYIYFIDRMLGSFLESYLFNDIECKINDKINSYIIDYDFEVQNNNIYYEVIDGNIVYNVDLLKKTVDILNNNISNLIKYDKGNIYFFRLSDLRGSLIFSSIGSKIPVFVKYNTEVRSNLYTEIKDYGLNNVIVKISIVSKIKYHIKAPFSTINKEIIVDEPIIFDIIRGNIPNNYGYLF